MLGASSILWLLGILLVGYAIATAVYNVFFHPLAKFPGPLLMRATRLPWAYKQATGRLSFDVLDLHRRYGDVVRIGPNELAFADTRAWKDIMGHRTDGRPENTKYRRFYRPMPDVPTDLLNAESAEEHGALRRQLAHGFSEKSMRQQEPKVVQYTNLFIQRLHEHVQRGETTLDMAAWYIYLTFDIIGDLAFGEPFGCLDKSGLHPWVGLIFSVAKTLGILYVTNHYPTLKALILACVPASFHRKKEQHEAFTKAQVLKRMELGPDRPDLIAGLLKKQDKLNLSQEQLESNSSFVIIAGSETTATLLAGATFLLLTNPDAMETLKQEVRSAFANDQEMNFQSTSNLPYLQACLNESMRMYPPIPIGPPRIIPPGGATIAGHYVPQETVVAVHHWAMYHNEKHFKDPFSFRPERFLDDPAFSTDNHEAFQPFQVGPRACLGRNLAHVEMRLIMAKVIFNFDMALAEDSVDWMSRQTIHALWNKGPLNVRLKRAV